MEDWRVGQPVVCVDNRLKIGQGSGLADKLVIDKIYHVTAVGPIDSKTMGLDVEGFPRYRSSRPNFMTSRFRPVRHDLAEGNKTDFIQLWDNHRIKTNVPAKTGAR